MPASSRPFHPFVSLFGSGPLRRRAAPHQPRRLVLHRLLDARSLAGLPACPPACLPASTGPLASRNDPCRNMLGSSPFPAGRHLLWGKDGARPESTWPRRASSGNTARRRSRPGPFRTHVDQTSTECRFPRFQNPGDPGAALACRQLRYATLRYATLRATWPSPPRLAAAPIRAALT
ncbi:uncharacterized protein PSFLO_07405 [Pseudozyma flocculosa]|uniref:Uncharacterized protein n=1 Tax=Pseudozyma flocculosa TaxID=84751 RepID=A0A5C3FBZ9_9BASI|nr:uncharacterized protein PSFLO_07405 [Pseudozyma flocculosa]